MLVCLPQVIDVAEVTISNNCLFGFQLHVFTLVRSSYRCADLVELVKLPGLVKLAELT